MAKKAKKYYAVKVGIQPGIYHSWEECKAQVNGFPGAVFKSFASRNAAELFISAHPNRRTIHSNGKKKPEYYAFVDGSYSKKNKCYGYGGFLMMGKEKIIIQGRGDDPDLLPMLNVAGELQGAMEVIRTAINLGLPSITIYYDYNGIEAWANGQWACKKKGTIAYKKFVQEAKSKIQIEFVHVKGHSGIDGNEEADRLAKEAVGANVPRRKEIWCLALYKDNMLSIGQYGSAIAAIDSVNQSLGTNKALSNLNGDCCHISVQSGQAIVKRVK